MFSATAVTAWICSPRVFLHTYADSAMNCVIGEPENPGWTACLLCPECDMLKNQKKPFKTQVRNPKVETKEERDRNAVVYILEGHDCLRKHKLRSIVTGHLPNHVFEEEEDSLIPSVAGYGMKIIFGATGLKILVPV